MKRQISFLWVAFAILVAFLGCSQYSQPAQTPGSALLKIECRNASVRQILELLRSGGGKDISVSDDGSEITAAFSPAYTSAGRLMQIFQDLNNLSGVLHVEVVENPHPIRQNF
jgi:hypothetical protein